MNVNDETPHVEIQPDPNRYVAMSLAQLRAAVASCRNEERIVGDQLREETARAEARAIDAAGESGIGRNADDRARNLTVALASDQQWIFVRSHYRCVQRDLELLQAHLEMQLDGLRERRLRAVERLSEADLASIRFVEIGS